MNLTATRVVTVTLLWIDPSAPFPRSYGNDFTVAASDGKLYRVVNFIHENLEALQAQGLTWPIDIRAVNDVVAIIQDTRIPPEWYTQVREY